MGATPRFRTPVDNQSIAGASPLRAARIANGYGLRQTARGARLDPSQLLRIEKGEGGLTVANLFHLAQVLGLRDLAKHLRPYVGERQEARS